MTITLFPADAVTGAPSYTGRMLRQTLSVLAGGATAARPLGIISGVKWGSGTPISVTTTQVTVGPHAGQIDAETAAQAGGYLYSNDANVTYNLAATTTNPRIDIVYVQVSDPAESDGTSTPGAAVLYLAGTPGATPVQPATPARSLLLGVVNVPATGGGSPTVTWAAPYLPHNAFYSGAISANGTVNTLPVNMSNNLIVPAVPYPTILDVSWSALFTANTVATDVLDLSLMLNGTAYRYVRATGTNQQMQGSAQLPIAANTTTTLLMQATKPTGTGSTTFPVDTQRRWLECTVNPA